MQSNHAPRRQRRRRRRRAALLLGLGAFGLAGASAASLGGLTSATLGADRAAVTSCDINGVTLRYTNTYTVATGVYRTSVVQVRGINAACRFKSLNVTLASAVASVGTGTIASLTAAANQNVTMTVAPNPKLVTRAAVVITG